MTSPMGNFSQGVYGDRMIGTTHRLLVWVDFQPALEIAIEPKGKDRQGPPSSKPDLSEHSLLQAPDSCLNETASPNYGYTPVLAVPYTVCHLTSKAYGDHNSYIQLAYLLLISSN